MHTVIYYLVLAISVVPEIPKQCLVHTLQSPSELVHIYERHYNTYLFFNHDPLASYHIPFLNLTLTFSPW